MKTKKHNNIFSTAEIENTVEGFLPIGKNRFATVLFILITLFSLALCFVSAVFFLKGAIV